MRSIDIYLIAGQSNGAGYTKYDAQVLASLWPDYSIGSQCVLYAGRAEYTNHVNTPQVSTGCNEFQHWIPAKAGMGISANHIGPEAGMAAYLSKHTYAAESCGKTAGIIKFAHGGTSLLNNVGGENAATGNWVSPSYAEALGLPYTGLIGGLYRGLLRQVSVSLAELKALGYTDIHLKGMFWMQGESDAGNPAEYGIAFKHFVHDLRADIGRITGQDASDFAIIIGEISETSGSATDSAIAKNMRFINQQRALADSMDHVYAVTSSQFRINRLDADGNNTFGQDAWHWVTADMFAIGELVGQCIAERILRAE